MVFQHVRLLCIICNNKHHKFEIYLEDTQWMDKGLWYIKDNLKTVHKDSYYLMCYVDAYEKYHAPMPDDASIDGGIPIPSIPYKSTFITWSHNQLS